jgi:hypothetical protein
VHVLDGPEFTAARSKHVAADAAMLLLRRLKETVKVSTSVPLLLAISKADELPSLEIPSAVKDVAAAAQTLGYSPETVLVSAFSRRPAEIPSGLGLAHILDRILRRPMGAVGPTVNHAPRHPRVFRDFIQSPASGE